jgi:hypothetical protein
MILTGRARKPRMSQVDLLGLLPQPADRAEFAYSKAEANAREASYRTRRRCSWTVSEFNDGLECSSTTRADCP